jgi:ribose transport system permease protein
MEEMSMASVKQPSQEQTASNVTKVLGKLQNFREGTLILVILVICGVMSFASPYFLTWPNIRAILLSFSTEGIVAVGMTIMLVAGGIDLSVGSVMCLAAVIAGKLFLSGMNPWLASVLSVAVCSGIGALIGLFVTQIGLTHFITTLAFAVIARGASLVITQGTPLSLYTLPPSFKFIGQGNILGGRLPFVIVIFFVIVVISDYFLRNSTLLRKVFYTGSNEKAAIYSGINVKRVKIVVAMLCSGLAALSGIIFMSKFGASTPTLGVNLEMTAISAAVIGGASLTGGEGTVLGAILGIGLVSTITSSMILLDVSVYWQELIRGVILLIAVSLDHLRRRTRKK